MGNGNEAQGGDSSVLPQPLCVFFSFVVVVVVVNVVALFCFLFSIIAPGEEVPGSIPAVAARSLLVGSVSV